jgi:hypothetical protein
MAAIVMNTTGHYATDRASLGFGIIVGGSWQIFAVFKSDGVFGTRYCSRIFNISSTSLTISHMELNKSGIRVAAYMMELPPRELLKKKLHETILSARTRTEQKELKE